MRKKEEFVQDTERNAESAVQEPQKTKTSFKEKVKDQTGTRAFRVGGYSVIACAIVLAICIVLNILVGQLPSSATELDLSSNGIYSLSDETKELADQLDQDVTIYWIVQTGNEDVPIESLLSKYESLGKHITVQKVDPDVNPMLIESYGLSEEIENNSIIVQGTDAYRYVPYSELYQYDYESYYTTGNISTQFSGESMVTSAIRYVTSSEHPIIYTLTGHGEATLSSTYKTAIEGQNYTVQDLSILTENAIPEDAAAVMILAPQSDISETERDILISYLSNGGKLFLATDLTEDGTVLTNLEAVMAQYGVTSNHGIVIEGNSSNYALGYPYALLPNLDESHAITSPLSSAGYYVLLPVAQGLTVSEELKDTETVTQLLTTSDSAYSKAAGLSIQTYDYEDGDASGPFALAVAVSDTTDNGTTNIVWVTSGAIIDDSTNMQVSGGNEDFFLNSISWITGDSDEDVETTIHAKTLSYDYLTMSSSTAAMLALLGVVVLPLACLIAGLIVVIRRKCR